jgi:hypothetical protein
LAARARRARRTRRRWSSATRLPASTTPRCAQGGGWGRAAAGKLPGRVAGRRAARRETPTRGAAPPPLPAPLDAQSSAAAKTAAGPAFIRGKSGAAVAPAGFPSRGLGVADANILVAAANRLVDIDDAGDEAELVDYWSNELAPVTKDRLAALGGKIEANVGAAG